MKSFSIHPIFRISEVSRRFLRFSCAIVFLRPQYLVPTCRWDKTARSTTEYTDECLRIVPALSQTVAILVYTCNGKLASFSAASCWCGVMWIWQYRRHSTACDGRQRLWCACSPFTTSSSKTIAVVKFQRIDVFLWEDVWARNGIQMADDRLLTQLANAVK